MDRGPVATGQRLRALLRAGRKASGNLSQRAAAEKAGFKAVYWQKIESGAQPTAPASTLAAMFLAAGVKPALLREQGYPELADLVEELAALRATEVSPEDYLAAIPGASEEEISALQTVWRALRAKRTTEPLEPDFNEHDRRQPGRLLQGRNVFYVLISPRMRTIRPMGRILTDATAGGRDAIFVVSLLAALAYTKWHFWWRTGWGLTRMVLLLSLAALQLDHVLLQLEGSSETVAWIGITATTGVLIAVTYMLFRIIAFNINRVRDPAAAIMQGRKHIERTPGASREEIEKLLAHWDETHTYPRN